MFNKSLVSREVTEHEIDNKVIPQRIKDGYISATDMCKAYGKLFANYYQLTSVKKYLEKLSSKLGVPVENTPDIGIPISGNKPALVHVVKGGTPELQGTWVHPQVAFHLAQWISVDFAVEISKVVLEKKTVQALPSTYTQLYRLNKSNVPTGFFSVEQELYATLYDELDEAGIKKLVGIKPSIAIGRYVSKVLQGKGFDITMFPTFPFEDLEGNLYYPRCYPESLLPVFRGALRDWIRKDGRRYFKDRLPEAARIVSKMKARQIKGIKKAPLINKVKVLQLKALKKEEDLLM